MAVALVVLGAREEAWPGLQHGPAPRWGMGYLLNSSSDAWNSHLCPGSLDAPSRENKPMYSAETRVPDLGQPVGTVVCWFQIPLPVLS